MSIYLGENCISAGGSSAFKNNNIGEIIQSTIPLTDAGLHLLDGGVISGSGAYSAFVNYMANLYSTAAKVSNIDIVGTLTDNNGVISGFSATDYALLTNDFPSSLSTEDWEFVIPYETTSLSSIQYPMCSNDYGIGFGINTNGQLILYISSNGTSWNIASGVSSTLTVQANTQYYFKLGHIKSSNTTYLDVSTDKENYTRYLSVSMSVAMQNTRFKFGVSRSNAVAAINGSIDLNESYININGSRWWTGRNPECFTDEAQWQTSVTNYGVCGKFVYDSVNNTVRLPKYSNKIYTGGGTAAVVGNGMTLGLTNGTNNYGLVSRNATSANGVYGGYTGSYGKNVGLSGDSGSVPSAIITQGITTNPTKSGIIADLSNITTSLDGYYYIVIATSIKTDIEVDIDEVMTDLNIVSNQYRYDGQWINSVINLASNFSFSGDTRYEYDLSTYLPNDNYSYEVLGSIYGDTLATSGKYVNMFIDSSLFQATSIGTAVTRTSSKMRFGGCFTVPVGTDRKIAFYDTGDGGTITDFYLSAYRRIGTNS